MPYLNRRCVGLQVGRPAAHSPIQRPPSTPAALESSRCTKSTEIVDSGPAEGVFATKRRGEDQTSRRSLCGQLSPEYCIGFAHTQRRFFFSFILSGCRPQCCPREFFLRSGDLHGHHLHSLLTSIISASGFMMNPCVAKPD